jgi:CheY-like chemotaxis protein
MNEERCRILLADDDEDDRLFFKDAIDALRRDTDFTSVNDGEQLIDYLEAAEELPHILFLDLNMPCKTGFDCLGEIRNNPKLKNLTVAIYSTSGSEEDIENTFVGGANVYIRKPHDFETLKKVLAEVININWQFHTSGLNKETFLFSI